jgi:Mg/Co/Ni transporter MgtE
MILPTHSVVVMDREYQSFRMFRQWTERDIYFVARLKETINYNSIVEKELPTESAGNIMKDEIIELNEEDTKKDYSDKLRRVAVYDDKQDRTIIILTNNFSWTAVL